MPMETKTEIKTVTYLVEMTCHKCWRGKMVFTGEKSKYGSSLHHKCDECGHFDSFFDKRYPHVVHESEDGKWKLL